MKNLIFIFCFLSAVQLKAQSSNADKPGLSVRELKSAKEGYVLMMKSETYILNKKKQSAVTKKLKDVELPFIEVTSLKSMGDIEIVIKKWLPNHIKETSFPSVDEGVKMIIESIRLTEKLFNENTDLFALIKRANKEQLHEIYQPEFQANYDSLYEMGP